MYRLVYNSTIETKFRSCHVKLNLRCIVTNVAPHGFSTLDTDECSFCEIKSVTLLHLFHEYRIIRVIWNKLRITLIFQRSNILFEVEEEKIKLN